MATRATDPRPCGGPGNAHARGASAASGLDGAFRLIHAADIAPEPLYAFAQTNATRLERYFPNAFLASESKSASRVFLERLRHRAESREAFAFAIPAPDGASIAGVLFLDRICPDSGVAEAAGVIGARWEGEGLMRQGMTALFQWARADLGLRRVRFLIGAGNARSRYLAEGLGFRQESRGGRVSRPGTRWEELLEYYRLSLD